MNDSALKYRAYKALLEADITDEQRQKLIEANIFQKIADFFGAGKDTLTTDLKKIFQNNKLNRRAATAKKNIEKEIEELREIAKEAGVSDEALFDMLNLTLKSSGVSPEEVASPPKPRSGGGSDTSRGGSSGTVTVTPETAAEEPGILARLLAAASGKKADVAVADAEKKNTSAKDLMKAYISTLSKESGVDETKTRKIVKALLDGGHVKIGGITENFKNLKRMILEKRSNQKNSGLVFERWQSLAGLNVINEGPATDEIVQGLKAGKIKNDDQVRNAAKDYKEEELKDLESNKEEVVAAVKGNPAFPGFDKKFDGIIQDLKSGSEKSTAKTSEASSAESNEYKNAFKDVRKRISDKSITDDDIMKIVKIIDVKDTEGAEVSVAS